MTSPFGTGTVSAYPVNHPTNSNVDPLLVWGQRWGAGPVGTSATITYSFPSSNARWISGYGHPDNEPFNGFAPFSAAQQSAARQALALWSEVANVKFVQVADTASNVGDIRFGNSAAVTNSDAAAWAYFPWNPGVAYPEAGDVWFDPKYPPNLQLQPGQFGQSTMVHEIGHALGLDHPFSDDGEIAVPPEFDNESYSIMSYTANLKTQAYASTPMLLDILAIQYIYGANMTTRTGNDLYKFSASVEVHKTIWDAGGADTLDFSNQTRASTVNLSEGSFSYFGGATSKTTSILAIAYGVTIEHATGGSGNDRIDGNAVANHLIGANGNDILNGMNGDDRLEGGAGNDSISGGNGSNWLDGGAGNDNVGAHHSDMVPSNDTIFGGAGNDNLWTNGLDDYLDGGTGADAMQGGDGDDVYVIDNVGDTIDEGGSHPNTIDRVISSISVNLKTLGDGLLEHVKLRGTAAINATGNSGDNTLNGSDGANRLDGGVGADILNGGKGNDTYIVDDAGDQVIEDIAGAAGGVDVVGVYFSYSLASLANVENLTLGGTADFDATGNSGANVLTGNSGNNILDGNGGKDMLIGGAGDDTYIVDSSDDVISETITNALGGGIDTVESTAATFTLSANIDDLILKGGAAINGTGNASVNTIIGNGAANVLDGAGGADILKGGAGNDVYVIDNAADVVDEESNTDLGDELRSSLLITARMTDIEYYTYTGALAWNFTGDKSDDRLGGGSGSDVLDGDDGSDTLRGNGGNDLLIGGIGDDYLDGGAGQDKMKGGAGDDTYAIDDAGDVIDEESNLDTDDKVLSSITVSLATLGGGAIEHATLLGTAAINATGNDEDNALTGNDGANRLDGGKGADILDGGKGNDIYIVDDAGDQVVENVAGATGGIDIVGSYVNFSLASLANVENLNLGGTSDLNATGNTGANVLTGNSGKNILDGNGGKDTLIGGSGDDTYIVDSSDDIVSETLTNGGIDTVESSAAMFALSANVENLKLTGGAAINGTGNVLANIITGNGAANILDGSGGADVLKGGAGNDVYVIDNVGDVVDEGSNIDLKDEIRTGLLIAAVYAGVENYTYTGASAWKFTGDANDNQLSSGSGNDTLNGANGDDTLLGKAGNDVVIGGIGEDYLDGGAGLDQMKGGAGDDTYVVDNVGDVINEEGNVDTGDKVLSSITISLATLGGGAIEHAALVGTTAINATGNSGDNTLTGNDAANRLDGSAGADILDGGKGNDTYIVDNVGDQVIENIAGAAGGVDIVGAYVSFSLASLVNVENLNLGGTANLDATGNNGDNILTGNSGNNVLTGGDGIDRLTGGTGRDTFDFNHLSEAGDTITDFALGAAGDILNIHDLLSDIGFVGADPFADAVLAFTKVGINTVVSIDADGVGAGGATTLVTLLNVSLSQANTDNYII